MTIRYCKACLEPDTRPGSLGFNEDGLCLPCSYVEQAKSIDWAARRAELEEIAAWGKSHGSSGYDCVIPVSGGKDSTRQSLYVRDELGLKPLLVSCSYPPEEQTKRGAHNMANLIELGFDAHVVSPAPGVWKRLMRHTFFTFGNVYKASELAIYVTAPKVATLYNIPLVIYGENPGLSWGGDVGSVDGDANALKKSNTLSGGDIDPYLSNGFKPDELYWYRYPSDRDILRANLRMIYLGYYIPDFNDKVNARVAIANGLECREGADTVPEDTGMVYFADALDCDFITVNQMLKHIKFGFGKTVEQLSGAIRNGSMTRDEAVELARKYDGRCADRYITQFCDYLGIREDQFWEVAEKWRNRDLFELDGNEWRLKQPPT